MTELVFKGKEFVWNHHLAVPFRPLVPQPDKGIGDASLDGNLIIQGDNLHALKALLPMYAGKVDCIFIDPPYNTGNEGWAYNDNVNAPMMKEWLEANPIGIEDGLRHDKWCAMMWPRLRLLHELLSEKGSLWITVDDNESHRAKVLLDEVFGESNFVANIVWQKKYTRSNDAKYFSDNHDHILCFAKVKSLFKVRGLNRNEDQRAAYTNPDGHPKGDWKATPLHAKSGTNTSSYLFANGKVWEPPAGTFRRFNDDAMKTMFEGNEIWFGQDGMQVASAKSFITEVKADVTPITIWKYDEVGHNHEANTELKNLGLGGMFQTPKPTRLIQRILALATDIDSVVLDSFSGSGTTANAVLAENKLDKGSRRFVLVEMEDYADKLTAERVRRLMKGYDFKGTKKTELLRESLNWPKLQNADRLTQQVEKIENLHGHEFDRIKKKVKDGELVVTGEKDVAEHAEGLGGSFTYCTLGEPVELDNLLTGENLPDFTALGGILFHMSTSKPMPQGQLDEGRFHVGEVNGTRVWMIYHPDLDWLKSPDAALTLSFARSIAQEFPNDRHLVFAPARYVSQRLLDAEGLAVEFVPLPFALYRVERG
jgi:adenine-specific DNA-methyltransferase